MLSSWHLTPEYINENWTEEMLALLLQARVDRIKAQRPKEDDTPSMALNDGKYKPEHHADVTTLAGKMTGFGSSAFKVTKR